MSHNSPQESPRVARTSPESQRETALLGERAEQTREQVENQLKNAYFKVDRQLKYLQNLLEGSYHPEISEARPNIETEVFGEKRADIFKNFSKILSSTKTTLQDYMMGRIGEDKVQATLNSLSGVGDIVDSYVSKLKEKGVMTREERKKERLGGNEEGRKENIQTIFKILKQGSDGERGLLMKLASISDRDDIDDFHKKQADRFLNLYVTNLKKWESDEGMSIDNSVDELKRLEKLEKFANNLLDGKKSETPSPAVVEPESEPTNQAEKSQPAVENVDEGAGAVGEFLNPYLGEGITTPEALIKALAEGYDDFDSAKANPSDGNIKKVRDEVVSALEILTEADLPPKVTDFIDQQLSEIFSLRQGAGAKSVEVDKPDRNKIVNDFWETAGVDEPENFVNSKLLTVTQLQELGVDPDDGKIMAEIDSALNGLMQLYNLEDENHSLVTDYVMSKVDFDKIRELVAQQTKEVEPGTDEEGGEVVASDERAEESGKEAEEAEVKKEKKNEQKKETKAEKKKKKRWKRKRKRKLGVVKEKMKLKKRKKVKG